MNEIIDWLNLEVKTMEIISDWNKKDLICSCCGTNKSVKYIGSDRNIYCNKCILQQETKEDKQLQAEKE